MKFISFLSLLTTSLLFAGVPVLKQVPVNHIYTPKGFDSNDNIEIVITGTLPNLCHKAPKAFVKRDGKNINITVKSLYYQSDNPYCPEMIVPFKKVVDLGPMDKGKFNIIVNKDSRWEMKDNLKIKKPIDDNIDNYQYAYVEEIRANDREDEITLMGYNPSDCYELDKVTYVSNDKDTYSVLPRLKKVKEFCPVKLKSFTITWKVPRQLDAKNVLLHVRTLNGNSVNKIIKNIH